MPMVDMSDPEYFQLEALDQSQLKTYLKHPKQWAYERLYKENKDTPALRFGTAFHAYLLGTSPVVDKDKMTEGLKRAEAKQWEQEQQAKGVVPVGSSDMQLLERMKHNFYQCDEYVKLLENGLKEQVILWQDKKTGIDLKAKLDLIPADYEYLVDLKTTRSAMPEDFPREATEYGYHIQAEFYRAAVAQIPAKQLNREHRIAKGMEFWCFEKTGACDWRNWRISANSQAAANARLSIRNGLNRLKATIKHAAANGYEQNLNGAAAYLWASQGYQKTPRELEFQAWQLKAQENLL